MVQLARKINKKFVENGHVEILHGSVSSLPFSDGMFDLVTAFEAYYFWPNLIDDLKEIKRVLKPGGTLLIANEVYKHDKFEKRNLKWAKWGDMMLHTLEEYRGFLNEAGYMAIEIDDVPEKNWIAAIAKKELQINRTFPACPINRQDHITIGSDRKKRPLFPAGYPGYVFSGVVIEYEIQ